MNEREALKLALEALEEPKEHFAKHRRLEAITAIKEALAQPNFCPRCDKRLGTNEWDIHTCTPPQRTWVHLTNEEHTELAIEWGCLSADWVFYGAAIERKVKEKNT